MVVRRPPASGLEREDWDPFRAPVRSPRHGQGKSHGDHLGKADPSNRPDKKRKAAEERLAVLPAEATWVWSDGSATGGVMDGGGGAMITFSSGDTREVRMAAGSLCSSSRAELFALRAALEELSSGEDYAASHPIVVCTDSSAALALLQNGPEDAQRTPVAADIFWNLLRPLADRGQPIFMHWVPAHRGLSGNERKDALAREASALPQLETPVDVCTIQRAVARSAASSWQQSWPDGWFRAIWRDRRPAPVEETDRSSEQATGAARSSTCKGSAVDLRPTVRSAAPCSVPPHCAGYAEKRPTLPDTFC